MIEVVFFDAGETLLHPHPSFAELFSQVCARRGCDVSPQEVKRVQDELAPYLIDHEAEVEYSSIDADASRRFWVHLYRAMLARLGFTDETLAHELYATFSHSSSYKLYDDALPALGRLQADGYTLGLISNFERWLEEMLIELEVGHIFDVTVISGVEGVEKPDPKIYELALEKAQVEPNRAVHVGDSPALDVAPAASVGMHTVLLDRHEKANDADTLLIRSLKELPEVISKL